LKLETRNPKHGTRNFKLNSICVFCGSSNEADAIYKTKAEALGKSLAEEKITLVFGGSNLGLMGVLADAVMRNGGKVKGVITGHLYDKGIAHNNISELKIMPGMNERKALMIDISDAFIAIPGGYGTLDEITEVLSLNQLSIINKPCALFNIKGFFNDYIRQLDHSVEEKLLRPEHRNMLIVESDGKRFLEKLKDHKTVDIGKWY
jgi:uncharacterized protein (TIGR00730 family)